MFDPRRDDDVFVSAWHLLLLAIWFRLVFGSGWSVLIGSSLPLLACHVNTSHSRLRLINRNRFNSSYYPGTEAGERVQTKWCAARYRLRRVPFITIIFYRFELNHIDVHRRHYIIMYFHYYRCYLHHEQRCFYYYSYYHYYSRIIIFFHRRYCFIRRVFLLWMLRSRHPMMSLSQSVFVMYHWNYNTFVSVVWSGEENLCQWYLVARLVFLVVYFNIK